MRDIFTKVMTGSMIAGAALLVSACSGGGGEANNTAMDNGLGTDVYNTEMPADNFGADLGNTGGNLGGGDLGNTGATTGGNTGTDAGGNMTTGGNTTNSQ